MRKVSFLNILTFPDNFRATVLSHSAKSLAKPRPTKNKQEQFNLNNSARLPPASGLTGYVAPEAERARCRCHKLLRFSQ